MTTEQAAQLIEQNAQLIELYQFFGHDLFPFVAVAAALFLGMALGRFCT